MTKYSARFSRLAIAIDLQRSSVKATGTFCHRWTETQTRQKQACSELSAMHLECPSQVASQYQDKDRKVADVWKKDVWEFQAKSGSSGSCRLFLYFLGKSAVQKMSGSTPGSPRHPSCRHPRPSEKTLGESNTLRDAKLPSLLKCQEIKTVGTSREHPFQM